MRKRLAIALLCLVAVCTLPGCGHKARTPQNTTDSLVVNDALGTRVALATPVTKIVSLAPNLTEIMYAVGAQDRLVGVTRFCTYPEAAKSLTKIGDLQTPDYECIAALQPSVILMSSSGNMPQAYAKLRGLGLTVFVTTTRTIEEVEMTIRSVAHVVGRDSAGAALADAMCAAVDSMRAAAQKLAPVDAAILLSVNPPVAVGNGFLDEALAIAGGRNVAHDESITYPQINRESFVSRNPRVIFIPTDVPETTEEIWRLFPEWQRLRATGTRIVRIDADMLMRPGPRVVEGVREMCAHMREN